MPHRIVIHHDAETDITDAAIWYHQKQPGLGQEFLAEVETTLTAAAAHPARYQRLRQKPDVRRALTNRFPYRIFFVRRPEEIVVFRVLHHARHDREWKTNIP